MTNGLRYAAVILAMLLVAEGLLALGYFVLALVALLVGLLWLASDWRAPEGRPLLDGLGLVGLSALAAAAVYLGMPGGLGLAAVLLVLAGWDLARFRHRLVQVLASQPALRAPVGELEPERQGTESQAGEVPTDGQGGAIMDPPAFNGAAAAARMERIHLIRLGMALAGGLVFVGLALTVHIPLSFAVALAAGIVAVYALSRVVRGVNS